MATCPQNCIDGIESQFGQKTAKKELQKYRKRGPAKTTQALVDFLTNEAIRGMSLLDIGGGIGAIQHELAKAGIIHVIAVDVSSAYIDASREEADLRGYREEIGTDYHQGNFVDLASEIPAADIVTLDRVICCYPDMKRLVEASISHARKYYGLVYPRDTWWMKFGLGIVNLFLRLKRSNFRNFVHSMKEIHSILDQNSFVPCFGQNSRIWVVEVFKQKISSNP